MTYLHNRLYIFTTLIFVSFVVSSKVETPTLQPVAALNIGAYVSEPSGLAFCNLTQSIFAISDKSKDHYIFELNLNGTLKTKWKIPKTYSNDIEAVACDEENRLIYIAEEELHRVSSFTLPVGDNGWKQDGDEKSLLYQDSFFINCTHTCDSLDSGIEGLTYDTKRDLLYAVNEKDPRLYFTLTTDGTILSETEVSFSGDLSGLCYDESLDRLWVVSDQSNAVYLVHPSNASVIDFWKLPLENAEGVTIDLLHDPPLLFIATDPNDPDSEGYVPALFTFIKPEVGTGGAFGESPPATPVDCQGCSTVWDQAHQILSGYESLVWQEEKHLWGIIILSTVIMILVIGFIVGAVILGSRYLQKLNREYDAVNRSSDDAELDEFE